jgi:alpha-amylase
LKEEVNSKIFRVLPREKAFYFFTSIGNYTGESATSLKEFMEKINRVNVKSLEFHLYRGDFEKWITEVLEDKKLAEDIGKLQKTNPLGDQLRNQLHAIISKRYQQLAFGLGLVR